MGNNSTGCKPDPNQIVNLTYFKEIEIPDHKQLQKIEQLIEQQVDLELIWE